MWVVERLEESEYFLGNLIDCIGDEFTFNLNAFLSASRSVTFVMQKCLAGVPDFDRWYERQRAHMRADEAMQFFLTLRNISQKQGPVAIVGGGSLRRRSTYRFVSVGVKVPQELAHRDVARCCADHLQKLAQVVVDFYNQCPFHACVGRALTVEGMRALGYSLHDVVELLGLPPGYTEVGEKFPIGQTLGVLGSEVDAIDPALLNRLANGEFLRDGAPIHFEQETGADLIDTVARMIDENSPAARNPRQLFLSAVVERIRAFDHNPD